jgi:DICT domain-containing protein
VKDFSIFDLALQLSGNRQNPQFGDISTISRRDFDERESFLFRTTSPGLEYACLMIENGLLLRTNRAGRVYAGFQKLSHMMPVIDRYLRTADISESVYVFGEPDWTPPRHPNIRVVRLDPDFKLASEWFLIADSPSNRIALVARPDSRHEDRPLDHRTYVAVKTSNAQAVVELVDATEGLIDWSIAA